MQDITEKICANTAEGFEKQLKDTRDGQLYWVGKMKDGRCWMLQNLALGSTSSAITLTAANSDVSSDWSLPALKTSPSGSATNAAIQSWNLGKWVLATPLLTTGCGNSVAGQSLSNCTKVGFVDVSDTTKFQPTYWATTGTWNGATVAGGTLVAVNCTSWSGSGTSKICTAGTYDPRYLVGNYYSWNAATAGTGGTMTSGDASGSICPKGWKLPITTTPGTFRPIGVMLFDDLLVAYGVGSSLTGTVSGTTYNIAGFPLRFVRAGLVSVGGGYAYYVGSTGSYWSGTAGSAAANARRLMFNASTVNPSDSGTRYNGMSVRCVAHQTYSSYIPSN